MAKQINCPRCMVELGETVSMVPNADDYYKCPECGAELWLQERDVAAKAAFEAAHANNYVSMSLQPGEQIMGGGGSTGKPKKANKKKSLAHINAALASEYHNH